MRRLRLTEHSTSGPLQLSTAERDALVTLGPRLTIQPVQAIADHYSLRPDSYVGVVRLPALTVEIQPKIPIDRLLFLVSYSVDPRGWKDIVEHFATADSVLEAIVPAFCRLVSRATYRGLLHGYRTLEEAQCSVRGRILFQHQAQRRAGMVLPIDVRFDDFTEDITENRILRAALQRLLRHPIRSHRSIRSLREILAAFESVSLVEYPHTQIPEVPFTRLNEHYRHAISCAEVILRSTSLRLNAGGSSGTCFLLDMNEVFEAFLHRSLLEALRLREAEFPRGCSALKLDVNGTINLKPDLSWWHSGKCVFVGDAKYKRLLPAGFVNADLYQLLAYTIASDLPEGMLIYAAGERDPGSHTVVHAETKLTVKTIDLSGSPEEILGQVQRLARDIRNVVRRS